jgi:D-glycero-D-manno-heptose 1,7-bisphosphate phosphatase
VATLSRAVFLDRDGTLNRPAAPGEYVSDPQALELLGGAAEAVQLLRAAGFACVVVSNQRGVALGKMTEQQLSAVDQRLHELVDLDASYYCTHDLETACACRKPSPGLLVQAASELNLDLARSWMVGDSDTDVEAALEAGCRPIKVPAANWALLAAARAITTERNVR